MNKGEIPSRRVDKDLFEGIPSSSKPVETGHYEKTINEAKFEYVFIRGSSDWLYVFLSPMFPNSPKRFSRWSYHKETDANIICVLDPMLHKFGYSIWGYFFGTAKEDYRQYLVKMVSEIAEELEVPTNHIVFYSDSNGGTAALFCADILEGSVAVAINPQLDLNNKYYASLEKTLEIDISDESYDSRTNVESILKKNSQSTFVIIVNIASREDILPLKKICKNLHINLPYGLSKKNNVITWTYNSDIIGDNHLALDNGIVFKAICTLIEKLDDNENLEILIPSYEIITRLWDYSFALRVSCEINQLATVSDDSHIVKIIENCIKRGDDHRVSIYIPILLKNYESELNKMDPAIMLNLGKRYKEGNGLEKDIDKAIYWIRKAYMGGAYGSEKELVSALTERSSCGDIEEIASIDISSKKNN